MNQHPKARSIASAQTISAQMISAQIISAQIISAQIISAQKISAQIISAQKSGSALAVTFTKYLTTPAALRTKL